MQRLPSSQGDFVTKVVSVVQKAFAEGANGKKLEIEDTSNALLARFAMAANSSVYVQSAISMLHVEEDAGNMQLAPASLYSPNALATLQAAVEAAKRREVQRRVSMQREEQKPLAQYIANNFWDIDGIPAYLNELAAVLGHPQTKDKKEFKSTMELEDKTYIKFVLHALDWLLNCDGEDKTCGAIPYALTQKIVDTIIVDNAKNAINEKRTEARKNTEQLRRLPASPAESDASDDSRKTETLPPPIPAPPVLPPETNVAESTAVDDESSDDDDKKYFDAQDFDAQENPSSIGYALARGLCGHRAPHQADCSTRDGSNVDDELQYHTPKEIAYSLRSANTLDRTSDDVNTKPEPPFTKQCFNAVLQHFDGDFAIDEPDTRSRIALTPAREVRWAPTGEHAEAFASAAAIEHAVARAKRLASNITQPLEKAMILGVVAALKIQQLPNMHSVAVAVEDGDEPVHTNRMVTRPIGRFRGKMLFAHDAGNHPMPKLQADTTGRGGWTQKMVDINRRSKRKSTGDTAPPTNTFIAPDVDATGFIPAPAMATGTPGAAAEPVMQTLQEALDDSGYFLKRLRKIVDAGLYVFAVEPPPHAAEKGKVGAEQAVAVGSPEEQRKAIWNDFVRYLAVANDKVIVFIRTLSGLIGEDADSLLVAADAATSESAKELAAQKRKIAEKVADFQAKVLETFLAGVIKESGLKLKMGGGGADASGSTSDDPFVIVDKNTEKELSDLASGQSGRPFFEANVALRSLCHESQNQNKHLSDVMKVLGGITSTLSKQLTASSDNVGTVGMSLAELAAPRNSYFVRLRDDTTAAIRTAYDRLCSELRINHPHARSISLYELIEGADPTLSLRFAEFVGHCLVSARTSTGVSALYASSSQILVNSVQAQVAIKRLCTYATSYAARTPPPNFFDANGRDDYFKRAPGDGCGMHLGTRAMPKRELIDYSGWVGGGAY